MFKSKIQSKQKVKKIQRKTHKKKELIAINYSKIWADATSFSADFRR